MYTFGKSELNARLTMTHPLYVCSLCMHTRTPTYTFVFVYVYREYLQSIRTIAAQTTTTNHLVVSSFVPIDQKIYINSNIEPCKYLPFSLCLSMLCFNVERRKGDKQCLFPYMQSQKSYNLHLIHSFIRIIVNSWSNIHVYYAIYSRAAAEPHSNNNSLTHLHACTLSLATHSHLIFHLYL